MSLRDPQHASQEAPRHGKTRRAILLTSYQTGATRGQNLGMPGYSYDLVAQLFVPLLARWGEVIPVTRRVEALESAAAEARQRGLDPVHVSFVACQDMVFVSTAPNVIVPAWEFPDVPAEAFDGNPRNNWVATANRCDLVLVGGQFTVEAFQRAGIRTPIRIVPVPTPAEYFRLPRWSARSRTRIACPAYVFPHSQVRARKPRRAAEADGQASLLSEEAGWRSWSPWGAWEEAYEFFLPPMITQGIRSLRTWLGRDRWRFYVRSCRRTELELSGVVYTSIFSPHDGRKNWQDLLSGFLYALHDRDDVTLLIKLITKERWMVEHVLDFYRTVGLQHRCQVVFITDYLLPEQMLDLVRASTYYLTTTRAEGNCLPLMNYLAAGRPGISACHTAISDYFDEDIGLTIPWQPDPTTWPQDSRALIKTTWARLDWPGLVQRLRDSYRLATQDRPAYDIRAEVGQRRIDERASVESVWSQLKSALDYLESIPRRNASAA
jgi:glycosyltransferase involved in cell wall biosynthesis